ncbi:S1 family peptidase [Methanococcus sp. CF]
MIRNTLENTMESTFSIDLPNEQAAGMPTPTGTGFFISPDGWFATAAHVVMGKDKKPRDDINKAFLTKERSATGHGAMCQYVTLEHILPKFDIALLKVDFEKNSNKQWLSGKTEFPFIKVSTKSLKMGEPVYSFGYPLSSFGIIKPGRVGFTKLSPRVTSAIISSNLESTNMVMSSRDPKNYVLDKALNYGNSGGPIISTETGHVHAICSKFQPVIIPQPHINDNQGKPTAIMIPSLYGVVSSFNNGEVIDLLKSLNVPIEE